MWLSKINSTTDVLIRLKSSICESFASKQHHVTIFFDLEKVYNTTWRYGILKTIHQVGLRGELPLFIKSFLSHRFFQVRVGNTLSDRKCQEEGVPQGSVLSVTLFALSINGVSSLIPSDVLHTLFVDDLSISFSGSRMTTIERKLQLTVNSITNWADANGFKFSTSKTVIVHFCRVRGLHPDPDIYLYGKRISCVQQTRFLGLTFDSKLNWVSHLKELKARCLKTLDILRALSHTTWGADRKHMLILYKALVASKLAYGCEVYSSATEARLKVLDAVHNAGIRIASGAFKSSPITSMLVDAGELPLVLVRQSLLIKYWYRVQRLPNSLTAREVLSRQCFTYFDRHSKCPKPFSYRVQKILGDIDVPNNTVLNFKLSPIPPWKLPEVEYCDCLKGFKSDFNDDEIKQIFLEHLECHLHSNFIFTDGSKSTTGVRVWSIKPSF